MSRSNSWTMPKKTTTKVNRLHKKEGLISPMLYDLLVCISPHPNYTTITKTIKKYLPKNQQIFTDGVGNLIVKVGENYTTMFSCHIDMVFRKSYIKDLKDPSQNLDLFIAADQQHSDASFIWGGVITDYKKDCYIFTPTTLGADDKAGIYILLSLIRAKVPGLYVFHTGEEVGGIGSHDIVVRKPNLVKGIKRAIAFDRMDYTDIIDHQRGGICCSSKFVNAFAEQLNDRIISPNKLNVKYSGATGTFTDTANYTRLIPECTNLSVGYFDQHTADECLDTLWLEDMLTPSLLKIDWEVLPTVRSTTPTYTPSHSAWPKDNIRTIGKYTHYGDITYNTPTDKLPPWELKKGLIKSCSDIGMRRLIKVHLDTAPSVFTIHQAILDLLKENAELKAKVTPALLPPSAIPIAPIPQKNKIGDVSPLQNGALILPQYSNDIRTKQQKTLFDTMTLLMENNFQVYDDNYVLYTEEICKLAETLKWAWKETSTFEDTDLSSMGQLFETTKELLTEIVVINTTLIADINYDIDGNNCLGISSNVYATVAQSIRFFKANWFTLGYDTYTGVQDDLKRIRDKIAPNS